MGNALSSYVPPVIAAAKGMIPGVGAIPLPGMPSPKPLTKPLIKGGGEVAVLSIATAFAEDPAFLELAAAEASMGKRRAAEALIKNFILALPSPTEAEIKMSLSATLTVLAAAAKKKAAPSVAPPSSGMPDVVGNVVKVGSTISSATVGKLLSPKPLSKPLIKKGGDAAAASIAAAFADDPKFAILVRDELEIALGKRKAAMKMCDNFLLALPSPTPEEISLSLKATADKYAKEMALLKKPPKFTKLLMKKGGLPAISAIIKLFGKNADFIALSHSLLDEDVAEMTSTLLTTSYEDVTLKAAQSGGKRLAGEFKLAMPSPSEAECKYSLDASLEEMTRLL